MIKMHIERWIKKKYGVYSSVFCFFDFFFFLGDSSLSGSPSALRFLDSPSSLSFLSFFSFFFFFFSALSVESAASLYV